MRKIEELLKLDGAVYVYLKDEKVGMEFLKAAESEGFMFEDGKKPTEREYAEIIALHDNEKGAALDAELFAGTGLDLPNDYDYRYTINYVGHVGQMAFQAAKEVDGQKLYRIDYEAFAAGKDDYFYKN